MAPTPGNWRLEYFAAMEERAASSTELLILCPFLHPAHDLLPVGLCLRNASQIHCSCVFLYFASYGSQELAANFFQPSL